MITTGSKFFYALALVLVLAAVVYGYSTGGGGLGPLSAGYKGGVGELFGYTVLLGAGAVAAFLGFASMAFRDADPEASAELLGAEVPDQVPAPGTSYWPVVGAFGATLTIVGVVLNNVFFVAGLIVLAAVAIEWTAQAWSERATGDPAVNQEIRNRLMLPIEVPVAGLLAAGIVVVGFSRVFLAASRQGAVWIAVAVAATIFVIGTVLSTRDRLRSDLVAGLLAVGAVVTIGLGIAGAVVGERDFDEHHGDEGSGHEEDPASEEEGAIVLEGSN